jgi:hypothetical protein
MERHLEELETVLGRPMRSRIHWIRGNLLGVGGLSLYGLALGSSEGSRGPVLSHTDRHEAGHAFMSQTLPVDADVPTVLTEGWAQAVALGWLARSPDPSAVALDLLSVRQSPGCPSMAELFGPAWYHKDQGIVYEIGPHLVRHLIHHYGPEKFIKLYTTIRPGNAAAVFRQVYGTDPSSIERAINDEADEALRRLQDGRSP